MDIVGITFEGEAKEYININAMKISKWIDPNFSADGRNPSLDVIFRLTVEHESGSGGFKKLREIHVYFRNKDFEDIIVDDVPKKDESKKNYNSSKNRRLEQEISPLEGLMPTIALKSVLKDEEKKRITVILEDYRITNETKIQNIKFSLRSKSSIAFVDNGSDGKKNQWFYDCLIEPYLIQTLKWQKEEFMPPVESLEIWLQIPKELYESLSIIDVQPVGHFEQMFLLGEDHARKFRDAGQPFAHKETLCINWIFSNVSISSPPEEIEVTCGLRHFKEESEFVERFESNPRDVIPILREILYTCKVKTLDFNYIISGVRDGNLKEMLKIFDMMVFRRYWGSMKKNLDLLLPLLEHFRDMPYGEELYMRYNVFHALIGVENSEDFSSKLLTMLEQARELENILDPTYLTLLQDFTKTIEISQKSKYKIDIITEIDKLYYKWINNLVYSDKYILTEIVRNLRTVVEREYEEKLLLPEIKAEIKTSHLAFSDQVGFMLTIQNLGAGEARGVCSRLIQRDDYGIIVGETESKAILMNRMRPFEPEVMIEPKTTSKVTISYEILYKDELEREAKKQFEGTLDFIEDDMSFRKTENPYIIGDIVREPSMFFGREELIQSIISDFKGKYQINPIFLYGQRRTGKTSILYHLKKKLNGEFAPVYFTALEIFGEKLFCEELMEKIVKELGFTDMTTPDIEDDSFHVFMDKFYPEIRKRLKGKKIVLMIDEYQRIDELIAEGSYGESVIDFLTALIHDAEIKTIISGFMHPDELSSNKWIEMMRFFTTKNVSFLKREDAIELIKQPTMKLMRYDDASIEKIISLSGCHPYFVQLICHTMVEYHNEERINLMGYNDINSHLFDYFEKGYNVFVDIINNQTTDDGRKILRAIQNVMEEKREISIHENDIKSYLFNNKKDIRKDIVEKELFHLERKGIIKRSAEHPDYYEFTIDLYRRWTKWEIS
ncbi:MAG: ATP-binding protein [Theionarchaea archaeon]|nr:ATP-binding protein [Theionarchaea archaeon]